MPELKCTVQTCVHNKQYLCNLDTIQVGGQEAKTPTETCCDSFEKKGEGYSNSYSNSYSDSMSGTASDCSCVDCKATQCKYNDQCKCNAGRISVEGGDACQCGGTACATFTCEC